VTRRSWLTLVGIIVIVAGVAGVRQAWQYRRLYSIYDELAKSDDQDEPMRPTSRHLSAIRKLRFTWEDRIESGGPVVDPHAPYGSAHIADDLGPIIGTRDLVAVAMFHIEVARALAWALENGELPAGRYRLAHLDNAALERIMVRHAQRLSDAEILQLRSDIPRLDPDGTFMFTTAHRRLLANLRFGWPHYPILAIFPGGQLAPIVNFRRPLGDMSFDIDMARILGLPGPQTRTDFDPALWRLYVEMLPALQTFVEHAQISVAADQAASP
jgi:hypothetical protein